MVHSTTRNAPHIYPSQNSILELWRTFPNGLSLCLLGNFTSFLYPATLYPTENDQWNFSEIPVEFQWNISPEFLWNSTEISVEFHWNNSVFPLNPSGISLKFHWNFSVIPLEFQWNISLEFLWNSTEISVEFHRNTSVIPLELQWNFTEISVEYFSGILLEYQRNFSVIPVEFLWDSSGISLRFQCYSSEISLKCHWFPTVKSNQ